MKVRRLVTYSVTLLLAIGSLGACGSPGNNGANAGDPNKGSIVWWGYTPGSPTNEEYIKEFNKQYPDIKVTWKQTTIDDYDATLRPALANSSGLDAFQMSAGSANGGVAVFGSNAIDLTDAVKAKLGDNWKDQLSATSVNALTVDGQLKALGVGAVYSGNLWINQDLFDKYNLKPPTTYAEWKSVCATFKKNGVGCFVQGAGQGAFNMDTFHAIADNVKPGAFTNAALGKGSWTDPSIVKALNLWKQLFDDGIMQEGALGIQQYPEANNLFLSGKYAMVMMGSWYTSNTLPSTMKSALEAAGSTAQPFTLVPIDFPDMAGTGDVGSLFGDVDYSTAVSVKSKNQAAATTFAVWLGTSKEGQQTIADSLNVVPALKSATPNWDKIKLVNPDVQNDLIKAYLEKCGAVTNNPRFAAINADMNQKLMDVLAGVASGQMTADSGASQLQQTQDQSANN